MDQHRKINFESLDGEPNLEPPASRAFFPPFSQVLGVLGISHVDLNSLHATITVSGLRFLANELLKHVDVDDDWYLKKYPDVKAAILSGDTPSATTHFRVAGYFEGRLPRELPFNPEYYFKKYKDLSATFAQNDIEGLRNHFYTQGYWEGRAGVEEEFAESERWRMVASTKA